MRRKDREITDPVKMLEIMEQCDCCRLGLKDGDGVYIVPLNFGFRKEQEKLILYFHSSGSGKKMELLKTNSEIGFEMDAGHELSEHESACGYSYHYRSIIGTGKVSFVEASEEKMSALCCILSHYSEKTEWDFKDEMIRSTAVLRMEVTSWSCKAHE